MTQTSQPTTKKQGHAPPINATWDKLSFTANRTFSKPWTKTRALDHKPYKNDLGPTNLNAASPHTLNMYIRSKHALKHVQMIDKHMQAEDWLSRTLV